MAVIVRLPGVLGEATGGATRIAASGGSLGAVIADLERRYPGLRGRILDETGVLPAHVNVFIGEEDARQTGGADAPVPEGAVVMIIPAMAGGRSRMNRGPTAMTQTVYCRIRGAEGQEDEDRHD